MAIAFDNSATAGANPTSGSAFSFSYTTSGSNRILFVGIASLFGGDNVTAVTYGGAAMTLISKSAINGFGGSQQYLYYLINPASGANNVSISVPSGNELAVGVASYTGALQSGQPDASATNTATSSSTASVSVTTIANNAWVMAFICNTGSLVTAGSGTTVRSNGTPSSTIPVGVVDNNTAKTPAGSVTLNVTAGDASARSWELHAASFSPALASAPTVTTGAVTVIGQTTATGNGNVTSDGGATITQRGVAWSTSANPTTSDSTATSGGTTGAYTASMTGLVPGTLYHVRAYAINSVGTSYGSDVTFTALTNGNFLQFM